MKSKFLRVLSFFIFPAVIYFVNIFLIKLGLYNNYSWLDIPMHFLGGVSIAYMFVLFLDFFKEENFIEIKNKFLFVGIVVALVGLVAIFWEFYEFCVWIYFDLSWAMTYEDTLLDLFMGLLGGLVVGVWRKNVN